AQRLAVEQFHDRIRVTLVRADVEYRQDVRMRKRSDGFALAFESREPIGVLCERNRQHLDRNEPIETGVARSVDLAHAARTEHGQDLVGTEAGSGRKGQKAASSAVILADSRRSVRSPRKDGRENNVSGYARSGGPFFGTVARLSRPATLRQQKGMRLFGNKESIANRSLLSDHNEPCASRMATRLRCPSRKEKR